MNAGTYIVAALIVVNLAAGFVCAIPVSNKLSSATGGTRGRFRCFADLIGIYFAECVAFAIGMCTQALTVALGFVWGGLLGRRLRNVTGEREILKTSIFVSLYGCLPTCSFAVILVGVWVVGGNSLLNVEQADKLGIPQFVPWPFNTLLGFCIGLVTGTIFLKTAATTGTAYMLIHRGQRPTSGSHLETRA